MADWRHRAQHRDGQLFNGGAADTDYADAAAPGGRCDSGDGVTRDELHAGYPGGTFNAAGDAQSLNER